MFPEENNKKSERVYSSAQVKIKDVKPAGAWVFSCVTITETVPGFLLRGSVVS